MSFPEIGDSNFLKAISNKEEFAVFSNPQTKPSYMDFALKPYQAFDKNYMNPNTPYKTLLIYGSPGSGKTINSISITEAYVDYIRMIRAINSDVQPFIYIITKTKLAGTQFLNSLLDPKLTNYKYIGKAKYNEYMNATNEFSHNPTVKNFERYKEILKFIRKEVLVPANDFYYKFLTYTKIQRKGTAFANDWDHMNFEYSIFIFDEIHEAEGNNAEDIITNIKLKTENLRLILLSATPANTNASEFVSILNMLRPMSEHLDKKTYFDPSTNAPINGNKTLEELGKISSGYVSYIKITNNLFPDNIDMGKTRKPFVYLKLVRCVATQKHQSRMLQAMKENDFIEINQIMTNYQIINDWDTVFPTGPNAVEFYTEKNFANRKNKMKIETSEIMHKEDIDDPNLLSFKNVNSISPKIYEFLSVLLNPDNIGIHYAIHSQIINGGVQLYINALKNNGIIPYGQKDISQSRCYMCKRWYADHKNVKDHEFHPAVFLALYRKVDEIDRIRAINILKSPENKFGMNACLLIGSNIIRQSIDITNIRYVHILCSQESLSMDEQIRGRASRLNSHMELPPDMRNVKIYRYIVDFPILSSYFKGPIYNPEEYKYWRQEKNFIIIQELEYNIKRYAMDCQMNKYINISDFIKSASKKNKSKYQLMCNLHNCNYKCIQPPPDKKRDTSTLHFINDNNLIEECKSVIIFIMSRTPALKLPDLMNEIIDIMTRNNSGFVPIMETSIILYSIFNLTTSNTFITNIMDQQGTLKWYDGAIFFVPRLGTSEFPIQNLKYYRTSNKIELKNIPGIYNKYDYAKIHDSIVDKIENPSITETGFMDEVSVLTPADRQKLIEEMILSKNDVVINHIIRSYGKFIITKDILAKTNRSFQIKTVPSLDRFKKHDIIGHYLNKKFRCINAAGDGWNDCIGKSFIISSHPNNFIKLAKYVGFEDTNKNEELVFKILFNENMENKDNRKKRKGVECMSISLKSVKYEWAKFFNVPEKTFTAPGKRNTCKLIRNMFIKRNNEITTEVSFMNNLEILFARFTKRIEF